MRRGWILTTHEQAFLLCSRGFREFYFEFASIIVSAAVRDAACQRAHIVFGLGHLQSFFAEFG